MVSQNWQRSDVLDIAVHDFYITFLYR